MQRFHRAALAAALLLSTAVAYSAPVKYTIVTKISRVTFSFDHQGFVQSVGTLQLEPGSFTFDAQDWSKSMVSVSMATKAIDVGDTLWNQQIRGDDAWAKLFKQPSISFRSTRIEKTDDTHGMLYGDLTLAGVTRPVALQLHINRIGINAVSEKPSVGFTATTTLKRSQFGLDAYSDLVNDDIAIQAQVEAAVGG
jgi:polyisoprenoid-binding protein YceI